jgi:mRNA interferase YafQ
MRTIVHTRQFEKDVKLASRRGKQMEKLKAVVKVLEKEEILEARYREHRLKGSYKGRLECHIEPDWLLIYKIVGDIVIFERTGTHADLFE